MTPLAYIALGVIIGVVGVLPLLWWRRRTAAVDVQRPIVSKGEALFVNAKTGQWVVASFAAMRYTGYDWIQSKSCGDGKGGSVIPWDGVQVLRVPDDL